LRDGRRAHAALAADDGNQLAAFHRRGFFLTVALLETQEGLFQFRPVDRLRNNPTATSIFDMNIAHRYL
jgi:hypothetical protein